MNKRLLVSVLGILAAVSAALAPGAVAATEFGDNCVANRSSSIPASATLFALTATGDPLPLTAPTSGIITKWKFNLVSEAVGFQIPQTLKVLRPNGPKSVQVIGESAQSVTGGSNSFDTRIPVQAGDRLGLFASGGSKYGLLYCEEEGGPKNRIAAFEGSASVGSGASYEEGEGEIRVPAVGVIEPDADNDGFGDETQDKCPQSAATQAECPTITIDIGSAVKKKGSVVVALTTTSEAPVKVAGTVKLGKGKKAKLNGGKHTVKPGKITRFTLKFPSKLKAALADLSKSKSLKLKVTASATDLIGRVSKDQLKVKLKGQG
jgi:hypothetical protein